MNRLARYSVRTGLLLVLLLIVGGAVALGGFWVVKLIYGPTLPSAEAVRELPLQVPLRVYTVDGKLIGEYGAERRAPLTYEQLPKRLVQAFLAAEDERFFEHPGVDWRGLVRASVNLALTGEKSQGGSTITMQLARNYFLSSDRTYERKFKEILLALRMEDELSKEQILETYLNKIYLGQRAYGVGAAAQIYFGKQADELTLSEIAVLAGLPKAPSRDNPVDNPARARERRDYVLRRMRELGDISAEEYQIAVAEPVHAELRPASVELDAHYVAEMVRTELYERYGENAYTDGYTVVTTLDATRQQAATAALRKAIIDYEERHGYDGSEGSLPTELAQALSEHPADVRERALAALAAVPAMAGMSAAAVISDDGDTVHALLADGQTVELSGEALAWAQRGKQRFAPGALIRLRQSGDGWRLTQVPKVQGAFISLDPHDGAVQALVGGYDFFANKFNRVIQARRQPGSGFKPFLYSSALNAGFTPASIILDAPVVFDDAALEDAWRPKNFSGKFYGPTRLREALVHSRNLVSIRLLQAVGIDAARYYISQFGLSEDRMPRDLSIALGSPTYTPLEMARAYSVFANDGFLIEPYFIREIRTAVGETLYKAEPALACGECLEARLQAASAATELPTADAGAQKLAPRVIDPKISYLMNDILHEITVRGTGARANELGRSDLGGKTGTTNDETDAWFYGFTPALTAVCWIGFDQPTPLGRGEVGGRAALPAWMDYMRVALKGVPEQTHPRPPGLVNVRIDPDTGRLAAAGDPDAIFEIVQADHVPEPAERNPAQTRDSEDPEATLEDLY